MKRTTKKGKAIISITLLFAAIILLIITNTTGDLNCQIEEAASCSNQGTILLYMQNDTGGYDNAHAENTSYATYANILCCNSTNNTLTTFCGAYGMSFLNLSSETNAHVQAPDYNQSYVLLMHFDNDSSYGENDTHVYDFSGEENNGTAYGSVNWTSNGHLNGAFNFDGIDDYIDCGNDASLDITDEITIEVWVKWNGVINGWADYRVPIYNTHNYRIFGGSVSAGKVHMSVWRDGEATWDNTPASTTRIDDGEWHHLVGTREGDYLYLFVDGFEETNLNLGSGNIISPSGNLCVGGRCTGDSVFNGTIDEVAIYNRALSANEIKAHYDKGLPSTAKYAHESCINIETDPTNISCSIEPTGCPSDSTCMVSMASDGADNKTNAHVSSCGVYDTEVCCHVNTRPTVVDLDLPINYTNSSTRPDLSWSNSTDADNDLIYYLVEIDSSPTFDTVNKKSNISIKETANTTKCIDGCGTDFTEGLWFWRVLSTDLQDNATAWSEARYFTYDATSPDIMLNNPINDSVFCNDPNNQYCYLNINFTVQDYRSGESTKSPDLESVWWVNSSGTTNSSEFAYSTITNEEKNTIDYSINTTGWPEGKVNISVWANDSSGNEQAIHWWEFFIDQSGPVIGWEIPEPNELVNKILNLTVTAIDEGEVNASWLKLDSIETNFSLTKDGDTDYWFYELDTAEYEDGQYTLVVYANDTTNQESNTSMRYVRFDNTAPYITIGEVSGPENNTWSKTLSNTFYFKVSETNAIHNCTLIIDGEINSTNITGIVKNTNDQSFTVDLTDGRYNWTVNCTDELNNIGTDNKTRIINVDVSYPQFESFDYPLENELLSRNQTINLTITDVISGVNHTWLEINNTAGIQVDNQTLTRVSGTDKYTYEWDTLLYEDGPYTINVYANDSANNENLIIRTVKLDNSGPNITLESPPNNSLSGTKDNTFQALVWDASAIVNCSLIINDKVNKTNSPIVNNTLQSFFTELTTGTYNWTVNCTDEENNEGTNLSIYTRTVDLDNPAITLTVPTDPLEFYMHNASINWSIIEPNIDANYTDVTLPNGTKIGRYYGNFTFSAQDNLTLLGVYAVSTYVNDSATNELTADATFTVRDTIAPSVILLSPENGTVHNSSNLTFSFNVSDYHSVSNCTLWINHTEVYTNTTITNDITVTQNINSTNITDEENVPWNITCYDNSSNLNNTEKAFYIDIDTKPPLIDFISPTDANNSYANRNWTYINVSITEPHNDTFVIVFNYTTNYTSGIEAITITPAEGNIIFYERNITNLTEGVYEYYIFANDTLSNESIGHSNVSETRTITIDETLPSVFDLLDPSNDVELTDDSPSLNWQESTDTNFDNYTIELSTDENLVAVNTTFSSTTSYYAIQESEPISEGTWYWRVKAADKANNERYSTSIFSFTISNVSKPTVYVSGPGGGGGGGGGKKIVYGIVNIIQPGTQTIYEGEKITTPLVIKNTGNGPIKGITLKAIANSPAITLDLSKNYIEFISAGQEETVDLEIKAIGVAGEYQVEVQAAVKDPTITDQAKFYVNLIGFGMGKKTILNEKLRFVGKLFESNPECLELNEMIEEAKKALNKKDYDKSLELIEASIASCEQLMKTTKGKILEKPAEPKKTLYILLGEILFFMFMFIMIYRYYRKRVYKGPIVKRKGKKGSLTVFIILIFIAGFFVLKDYTSFTVFEDTSQEDFDLGTYSNTEIDAIGENINLTTGSTLGNFTSRAFNANFTVEWQTINWSWGSSTSNDNVTMQVRTSVDNLTWSSWSKNVTNTSKLPDARTIWTDKEDFIGNLFDTSITSQTGNITLNTDGVDYNETGSFTSAVLDLGFADVNITTIEFTVANISSQDNITIETSTSADNITWEAWMQTNVSKDQVFSTDNRYFKWNATFVTNDTKITPVLEELIVNYERNSTYLQYRATLSTDDSTKTPYLKWVNITYQDATIPLFEFISPTELNNSYISNNFTYINFTLTEPNNDTFYIHWNGTQYNQTDMNETTKVSEGIYSYGLNLTELLEGSYEYYIWANDTYGHQNQTANRTITIDQTAPTAFNLSNPSDENRSTDDTPFLLWEDSNDTNLDNYTIEFDTNTDFNSTIRTYHNTSSKTSSNYQIEDSEALPSNGTWYWRVTAYDKAGQSYTTNYSTYHLGYIETTSFTPGTAGEGGGGGKRVERRKVGLEIIKPSAISFFANRQVIVPLILVNDGTEILQDIELTAESELDLEFKNNFFEVLRPNQEINTELIIKPIEDPKRYNILVKARVRDPEFSDSIMLFIDIVEFGLGNKTEAKDKLTFVVDFIRSHEECAELKKFLIEAQEEFRKNEFDNVLSLAEQAIQSCKDLVSTAKEKRLEKKRMPQWYSYLPFLELLLFMFIFSGVYSYYKRIRFKRKKHW